jgi:hypothetical protein
MALIDRLERKFRWLAVPRLLTILCGLQLLVYLVLYVANDELREDYAGKLCLNPAAIRGGEVWRVFSYILAPSSMSLIFMFFGLWVQHFIGQCLESEMGAFQVTLFCLSTVLLAALGSLLAFDTISNLAAKLSRVEPRIAWGLYRAAPLIFGASLAMMLGLKCPNLTFRLYFVIPVSARLLGWLAFGSMVYLAFAQAHLRASIILGLIPFFVVAAPDLYRWYWLKERVWKNRPAFDQARRAQAEDFARCHSCGRTDSTNPELTFRVAADGEEYCSEHLPRS